jgi:hypothetical protein
VRRRLLAALAVALATLALGVGTAFAHDPIFVSESTPPEASPLIEDGTISFATYGRIEHAGGTSSVRVRLAAGERLGIDLLVPDREPERSEPEYTHLSVKVTNPDGTTNMYRAREVQERFDEPFSKTSYLRLLREGTASTGGVHTITVASERPTRFTLATGVTEQFGSIVSDYERRPLSDLAAWYSTPPPTVETPTTAPATSAPPTERSGGEASRAAQAPAPPLASAAEAPPVPAPQSAGMSWAIVAAAIVLVLAVVLGAGAWARRSRRATTS